MYLAYPYTDLYNLNLDWMIKAIKEVQEVIENLGSVVNTFNNREGDVVLNAADVTGLGINTLAIISPSVEFEDLTQQQLKQLYDDGVRILVSENASHTYDKCYYLRQVGTTVTGVFYDPISGSIVHSVNGASGNVTLNGTNIPFSAGANTSIYESVTASVNDLYTALANQLHAIYAKIAKYYGTTIGRTEAGEYFIFNDVLYKAVQLIPEGGTITESNAQVVSSGGLNAVIDDLNAASDELYAYIAPIESMVFPENGQPGSFLQLDNEGAPVWGGTPYIVIDPTLSVQGEAAEAKATGDAVADLKRTIKDSQGYFGFVDFGGSDGQGDSKGIKISQHTQVVKAVGTSTALDVIKLSNGFTHGSGNTQGSSEHLHLIEGHQYFLVVYVKPGSTYTNASWGPDLRIIKSDSTNLISMKVPVTGDNLIFSSVFTATASNTAAVNFVVPSGATVDIEFVYGIVDVAVYNIWNNKVNNAILSDIATLFEDSEALDAKLSEIVVAHYNFLDTVSYDSGKYWGHGSLTQSSSATAVAFAKIPIVAGKTYYYRSLYAYFCNIQYADESIVAFSDNTANAMNGYFTAAQNGYVYITVHTSYLGVFDLFTDSYMSYTNAIRQRFYTPNKLLIQGITNYYTVKKDGTGDFTKITDAVKEAVKFKNSTVFIDAGEYDLVEEFGNELATAGASMGGIFLKNGIHLIGTPETVIKFNYTGDNSNIKQYWSVFNANTKGFILENINIEASNIRYCVHDELNGYNLPYHNTYKNCKMYLDNSENTVFPASQCIGGGFGGNGTIIIDNCHFETEETSWGAIAVSWHNSSGNTGKSKLFMHDCYFEGTNTKCRFTWNGSSTEITEIYVSNNSFGDPILIQAESESALVNNIAVHQWNNEVRGS